MSVTSKIFRLLSSNILETLDQNRKDPERFQNNWFGNITSHGEKSSFGKEHGIHAGMSYESYAGRVPLRSYDMFESYI